ncbi:DEAD/DEAH box helicase family protein [Pseudoxanthomonas sp. PXM02]|uniref:DEAD/DEAH box helicase n=1 Tax=Pseudoxanthomonas sp. PXM02 TaxID=2769294 RepID=UPI001785D5C2|nr:DEAD/DEAH box helicase family protein [Pseudoxanthomonas sp. PXM02]MBD9478112.1 DEAD/DEAH box helicase family protein [Pseudoxanthomonas sp. PXM02]
MKDYQEKSLVRLADFLRAARMDGIAEAFAANAHPDPKSMLVPEYRTLRDKDNAELSSLRGVPYVAIRIPTGGGKTLMGAHFIRCAADNWLERDRPLVVWLVPSRTIKQQTLDAFKNRRHPYRLELDAAFGDQVSVLDSDDIEQLTPQELATRTCIVVATMAAARVHDIDIRDFYAHKEALEPHFIALPKDAPLSELEQAEDGTGPRFSFANLLRLHRPLVITDEAHNATSDLSGVVYERLVPSAIIELTATPDMTTSNVLVRVSASQLFAEQMIKLPVLLEEHLDGWDVALRHALLRRQELEEIAKKEPDYIRPILLIQAEHKGGEATVDTIYEHLTGEDGERIDKDWVKIATGDQRELDGVDLFAESCPVRVIITMEALKEGWDCSFAYVLCSVSGTKSATDIEQLLGRVLRMPYARTRDQAALNKAYAHVVSPYFGAKAVEFTEHLEGMGFSRLEAAQSVPVQPPLIPGGGEHPALKVETLRLTTSKKPDLANVPAGDLRNITIKPVEEEGKFEVEIKGAIQPESVEAIAKVFTGKAKEQARTALEQHNTRAKLRETPAQKGVKFEVPQLSIKFGDRVVPVENDLLVEDGFWNPADAAGALDTLTFDTRTQTWEIDIGEKAVKMNMIQEPQAEYLSGLTGDWREADLLVWLEGKVVQNDVRHEAMIEWIAQAIAPLKHKGYSLGQLVRGRFIVARRLLGLLDEAKTKRGNQAHQRLFALEEVVVDPSVVFKFSSLAYPMRSPCPAPMEWPKHYYEVPGDLPFQRKDGTLAEEFRCATAIERNADVEVWVRNLAHPTQFRFPTATGSTYPDFIAKLKDGRILVIEYKGDDRYDHPKNAAKRAVGELWARKYQNGLYLMPRDKDEVGRDIDQQIAAAIAAGR